MNVSLQSTPEIVELSGVRARVWQGTTDAGLKVRCYIALVAVDAPEAEQDEALRGLYREGEAPSKFEHGARFAL